MLARLSFHHKKSEKKTDNIHTHQSSQNNEKQNNQQNLNRVKKSLKFNELDPSIVLKPTQQKNYFTNADNKVKISLNFNSTCRFEEPKTKLSSQHNLQQEVKKQIIIKKQKPVSITDQFLILYGNDIIFEYQLMPIHRTNFLKNHQVDSQLRARMLDWMVEVTKSYKFINKSYFGSVELMDRYFANTNESVPVSQLHIIGVIAMYIASKMDQVYPLKIKTIYEKIVHKKISKQALIDMEKKIFDALDHKVNSWTFFDLALLKIADQFSHDNVEIENQIEEVISFVSKCILYDYDIYLKYDMETFAKVLVKVVTQVCDLPSKNAIYSVTCHQDVVKSYKKFKTNFKGLNNIFKFTDEKIVNLVDSYFFEK